MDWGAWEGWTLARMKAVLGDEFDRRTSAGLDLRPDGGESPRDVRDRFAGWAARVAASGRPAGAVCHKGVFRAALSLATGWDMIDKPPFKIDWGRLQVLSLAADGTVSVAELNIELEPT